LQKTIEAIPCRLDLVVRAYFRIVVNFILLSELLPEAPQTLLALTKKNLHFLACSVKSRLQEELSSFQIPPIKKPMLRISPTSMLK
jgi:hypothetical protein